MIQSNVKLQALLAIVKSGFLSEQMAFLQGLQLQPGLSYALREGPVSAVGESRLGL